MVLGHAFLCASAGFALHLYSDHTLTWSFSAFVLLLGHGVLGAMFCCSESKTEYIDVFNLSLEIIEILPLPFINAELYLRDGARDLSMLHGYTALVPIIVMFILRDCIAEDTKDFIIIVNVISLIYLGVLKQKALYCALAGVTAVNRFNIGKIGKTSEPLSFGLAAFCLLASYILKPQEFARYL